MSSLFSVAQIRAIEQAATSHLPIGSLMQKAGAASARLAIELLPGAHGLCKVLVLVGPGNNGGDALETAVRLAHSGIQVSAIVFTPTQTRSSEAKAALQRAQASTINFISPSSIGDSTSAITSTRWSLVIDGLFGIGLQRPIVGHLANLVEAIRHLHCPVLALDVPSGLDADTGNVIGQAEHHGVAIRATHTISFIGDKPGLHTAQGRDYAGQVHIARLEIDSKFFVNSHVELIKLSMFARFLKPRLHHSHKGSFGSVVVVGGANGMTGAPILAARCALHAGAGRAHIAFVQDKHAIQGAQYPLFDPLQAEIMCHNAHDFDFVNQVQVIGPGLGTSRHACQFLSLALNSDSPLVLDADALNLIALEEQLQAQLQKRKALSILTPHPLEAARLLGHVAGGADVVQANRLAAAAQLAQRFQVCVILKGSGSVIANPHGHLVINTTGNPALASAGSGDVLAGLCGALLAQHWPTWEAALAACWLHGKAADRLVEQGCGPIGLVASELIGAIRRELNLQVAEHAEHKRQA